MTQPADVATPAEAEHLTSPGSGHPAGETKPYGGDEERVGASSPRNDAA